MLDEHIPFLEGIGVEQKLDAFTGGQLALGVLAVDTLLPAARSGLGALAFKLFNDFVHGVPRSGVRPTLKNWVCADSTFRAEAPAKTINY